MFLFVCISLTADGFQHATSLIPPTATLPSCLWSRRILPSLPGSRLTIFYRDASSAPLLTISRLLLHISELKSCFVGINRTHDFRTRGYARLTLDHSGDVRPDDGACLDWSEVKQGPWQGCVLSPLLLNIFFAAVLTVVVDRFCEATAILAEAVCLKKEPPASMRLEPAMDYVRRAVWGMPYADEACIVSRSPQGRVEIMGLIAEVYGAFALTVSAKKTDIISMPPPRSTRMMVQVEAVGQMYKQVQSSTYLRGVVAESRTCPLKSSGGPAHAGCTSSGTYVGSTSSRKGRSPSGPEW